MKPTGIFVTGTDTGAGKTVVSCAILRALSRRGLRTAAFKPVETGCRDEGGTLVGEDCERLAAAASAEQLPGEVAAYLFREPAAPMAAAQAEDRHIEPAVLRQRFEETAADCDFVLVESAGGLMVPVSEGFTTRDLARDLGLPALCVVASKLGCINHALLTLDVLRSSGIETLGYVVNEIDTDGDYALALRTNREMLASFARVPDLGAMPRIEDARRGDLDHLADLAEHHLNLDALLTPR